MQSNAAEIYDKTWDAREYLRQYYATSHVTADERSNIAFARRQFGLADRRFDRAIEVGCGPTLHHALLLAPYVNTLDMADYVADNLTEIRRSLDGEPGAHDWSVYLGGMLEADGPPADALWATVRSRVRDLRQMDIRKTQPGSYDLVASYYCSECVASTQEEWLQCLSTLAGLTAPGGVLLLSVVRHCNAYNVCGETFPAKYVDEADFVDALATLGFAAQTTVVEVFQVPEWAEQGFDSICCVWAVKQQGRAVN